VRKRRVKPEPEADAEDDSFAASPSRRKDFIAFGAIAAFGLAIAVNALFLQSGPHPAPIFANKPPAAAAQPEPTGSLQRPLPRARPAETEPQKAEGAPRLRVEIITDIQRELTRRGFYDGPSDGVYGPKTDAAVRDFEHAAGLKPSGEQNEALLRVIARSNVKAQRRAEAPRLDPIAELIAPPKRVMAVQRVLSDFGYGQLTPNGVLGPDTLSAIERFERQRKLPVTGQMSEALVRELGVVSGRPLE
jgi:peptidoglycan hydrolase-like protein with peptidoglycan-binding domain